MAGQTSLTQIFYISVILSGKQKLWVLFNKSFTITIHLFQVIQISLDLENVKIAICYVPCWFSQTIQNSYQLSELFYQIISYNMTHLSFAFSFKERCGISPRLLHKKSKKQLTRISSWWVLKIAKKKYTLIIKTRLKLGYWIKNNSLAQCASKGSCVDIHFYTQTLRVNTGVDLMYRPAYPIQMSLLWI